MPFLGGGEEGGRKWQMLLFMSFYLIELLGLEKFFKLYC